MNPARLRWRCRRGTRELDLLLLRFLDGDFEGLDTPDQQAFEALLEQQDPDLARWLLGAEPPPAEYRDIVARIRLGHQAK